MEEEFPLKINKILMGLMALGLSLSQNHFVSAQMKNTFPDVPSSHWAYESINQLVELGYVKGYSNGKFGINDNVTRAQAATILVRWLKDEGVISYKENITNSFTDVPESYWAHDDILLLVDAGYMQGKGNHQFEPDTTVTRAEMATILVNILCVTKLFEHQFDDVSKSFWGSESIKSAYSQGLVRGIGNNKYDPSGVVTRAAFTQFIVNGIEWSRSDIVTTEEVITSGSAIKYPYKSDYVDSYNLFQSDLVIPETDELWEQMMSNQYFEQFISNEGQEIIVSMNQKYSTDYQFSILNRSLQIVDDNGFVSLLSISEDVGADGYRLIFNSNKPIEVEMARSFLQLFDTEMYKEIEGDLNIILTDATNSNGKYSGNTEDVRIIRENVTGYKKIYFEIFYKTKGIWMYVDPN